jgi:hypothetical protein
VVVARLRASTNRRTAATGADAGGAGGLLRVVRGRRRLRARGVVGADVALVDVYLLGLAVEAVLLAARSRHERMLAHAEKHG